MQPTLVSCARGGTALLSLLPALAQLCLYPRDAAEDAVQPDRQRRLTKALVTQAGTSPAPEPVSDTGQEGEHEVELLLNHQLVHGMLRYLVRWRGYTSADDTGLRLDELGHCPEKVAEYDAAAPRRRMAAASPAVPAPRRRRHRRPAPAPFVAPFGFRIAAPSEVPAGAALVGRRAGAVLYLWQGVRGSHPSSSCGGTVTVARRSRAGCVFRFAGPGLISERLPVGT